MVRPRLLRVITAFRDVGAGFRLLLSGFGLVLGNRRLLARAALPVLVTSLLLFGALGLLAVNAGGLAAWATPFADDWNVTLRSALRVAAGIVVVIAAVAVSLVLFAGLTITVGSPFYESIAEHVEDTRLGGVPQAQRVGWARAAGVGLRGALTLVGMALLWAVPLFALGFVPVFGQTVVPVLAVCVGAWLYGLELTAIPFTRRGIALRDQRARMRRRRALVLGFGVPTYLLCLIPFAALLVFPAAMAGGTVLAHRVLTEG